MIFEIYRKLNRINLYNNDKKITYGDKYIWRPISHVILTPLIYFGFKNPNILTLISIISLFFGLYLEDYWILYFLFWAILDCADGSLARYNIKTKGIQYSNGELIDAIGGYFFITTFWLKIYLFYGYEISILTLIFNILARTIYLKYNLTNEEKNSQMSRSSNLYIIYENIEFGSFMLIIFLIALFLNQTYLFVCLYFILSFALLSYSLYKSFKNFNNNRISK